MLPRLAYRSGVSVGVVAPKSSGFLHGISAAFSTGARRDGFYQDVAALHVTIAHGEASSVSTQIAALRRLLNGSAEGELGVWFARVVKVRS